MKRASAKPHASHKPRSAQPPVPIGASGRVIQLSLDRDEWLGLMHDGLESSAAARENGRGNHLRS